MSEAEIAGEMAGKNAASLLDHPALWRAGQLAREPETLSSGFEPLDRHLPGKGWPQAGLCEFLLSTAGLGELRLLLPALKTLSQQARWITWVNPPFIPYAPALKAAGVDIDKILLIHPKNHKDALWALERATRSGSCSAALAWLDERLLKVRDTQRLLLAARQGGALSCLFRPEQGLGMHSMAELRIAIKAPVTGSQSLCVDICKRRGGWPVSDLEIPLQAARRPAEICEQLSLWRQWRVTETETRIEQIDPIPPPGPRRSGVGSHVVH